MAEKKERETRPYTPEQLVEVLERIAKALENIDGNLEATHSCLEAIGGILGIFVKSR